MEVTPEPKPMTKRKRLGVIVIPLVVSFVCAIGYRTISNLSFNVYFLWGLTSVLVNTTISFLYAFVNKERRTEVIKSYYGSYPITIVVLLTLIIPYSTYFILVSIVVSGFKFPFKY